MSSFGLCLSTGADVQEGRVVGPVCPLSAAAAAAQTASEER